jgi:predicted outer membrane repeat protein
VTHGGGAIYNEGELGVAGSTIQDNEALEPGGGIANDDSGVLTITDSTLSGNKTVTDFKGGGALMNEGSATLTNVTITANGAVDGGGGIYNDTGATLSIEGGVVSENKATDDFGGGAGISNRGSLTITGLTCERNIATSDGGGILNRGILEMSDSVVRENEARDDFGSGGGFFNHRDGEAKVTRCAVEKNSAIRSGGGIANDGMLTVRASTIAENRCPDDFGSGGGIFNDGTVSIINSTVSGNVVPGESARGGGITNDSGAATTLAHSTVAANESGRRGGGISNSGTLTLTHTIVAMNAAAQSGPDGSSTDPVTTQGFNLIGDATDFNFTKTDTDFAGSAEFPVDAKLAPLSPNEGPTRTHLLGEGSPAIDAGHPDFKPEAFDPPLETDQRGVARVRDLDSDGTARVNIGSVEAGTGKRAPIRVDSFEDEEDSVVTEGKQSLREALTRAKKSTEAETILIPAGSYNLKDWLRIEFADNEITLQAEGGAATFTNDSEFGRGFLTTNRSAKVTLRGLIFKDIRTLSWAVSPHQTSLTVESCTFENNEGQRGGAIAFSSSEDHTLLIRNSVFKSNSASSAGGAIHAQGELLDIEGCTFEENRATAGFGGGASGGAIFSFADAEIKKSVFYRNEAEDGGAVYFSGAAQVHSCVFASNTAADKGGAAVVRDPLELVNTSIAYNSAGSGGALALSSLLGDAKVTARHSTIALNAATNGPGGILFEDQDSFPSSFTMGHTILALNGNTTDATVWNSDHTIQSLGFNLIGDRSRFEFIAAAGDRVGTAAGPIDPRLSDVSGKIISLKPDSPAVDNGDPSLQLSADLSEDLRGLPRVSGRSIDIGAFEFQGTPEDWSTVFFSEALRADPSKESTHWGARADSDRDGLSNFGERALGGDPTKPASAKLPVPGVSESTRLRFQFQLDERLTDTVYVVQSSSDAQKWTDGSTYTPMGSGKGFLRSAGNGTEFASQSSDGSLFQITEEDTGEQGPEGCFMRLLVSPNE